MARAVRGRVRVAWRSGGRRVARVPGGRGVGGSGIAARGPATGCRRRGRVRGSDPGSRRAGGHRTERGIPALGGTRAARGREDPPPGGHREHGGVPVRRVRAAGTAVRGRGRGGAGRAVRGPAPRARTLRGRGSGGTGGGVRSGRGRARAGRAGMKFLCLDCDALMDFAERREPGDGTFAAAFTCPRCNRSVALLANPMETQLVGSLGVKIGGRALDAPPFELARGTMRGRDDAFVDEDPQPAGSGPGLRVPVTWSAEARERLLRVPGFVRGMVKRVYADYAAQRGIGEITPEVMDRARAELGLEGM